MSKLKQFYDDKALQLEWANFITQTLDEEVLLRTYAGKDTTGYKQARDIIAKSFGKLNDMFKPKPKQQAGSRAE
jgi:hypothetical protein